MSDSAKILVNGLPVSLEDWSKPTRAPADELPRLGEAQREVVRMLGIAEADYAPSLLLKFP